MPTGHPAQAQQFAGPSRHETIARTARELNRHAATPPPNITKNADVNAKTAPTVSKGQPVTGTKEGEGQTANLKGKVVTGAKTGETANLKGQAVTGAKTGETANLKGQAVTGAKTGETANLKGQSNLKGESNLLKGQNQNVLNRQNAPQQKMALAEAAKARVAEAKKTPILKNPVFASTSPRAMGTTLSNWTFRGHFAQSAFFRDRDRFHHRHLGIVLGFIGVVFWPYAYDDFVDYTFAPYAYDTFWPYAYDDVYAGIFGGYAPEYYAPEDAYAYAYAGSPGSARAYSRASRYTTRYATRANAPLSGGAARVCSGEAQGLTDFSIQKIADRVQPTQDQQALLDDLKAATVKAVQILQAACPTDLPSTATGRITVMRARIDAMLQAVETVAPALDKFYQSLNDEQRARFNAMDQGEQQAVRAQPADIERFCKGQDTAQARLPIDRIERTLHLNPDQENGLKALDDATAKAAEMLKDQCQSAETLTPTGRLAAMADRLRAMSKALEMTEAALAKFYDSLSDEQKAQFDRINVRQT